ITKCGLPVADLIDLIDARGADLYDDAVPALAALEHRVGRTVARLFALAASILGGDGGAAGASAGLGFGLAGTLKAFPFLAAPGRLLLPQELLARHAVEREDILAGKASAGLAAVLAALRGRAGEHLAEAERRWDSVPPAVAPAFLPVALAWPLLARMEKSPDPF